MTYIFWISIFGTLYSYFIYPYILILLPYKRGLVIDASTHFPDLTIVITAYNEEKNIRSKIENTLALNYPIENMEIIVASDASTDDTDMIVMSFGEKNVRLVRPEERKGKEYAQFTAIKESCGDIIVFTDVATKIEPQALKNLVVYFSDKDVGAISSVDRLVNSKGQNIGEGAYVKYEMWLRRLESRVAGLVGLSGSFFAATKEICQSWDTGIPSDFNTAINCTRAGKRAVSADNVIGVYEDIRDESKEYSRKYRTVLRGVSALLSKPDILNPLKYGMFAFQMWSHKIMRWLVPWFLMALAVTSIQLYEAGLFFHIVVIAQSLFYLLAIFGWRIRYLRKWSLFKVPFFFMQVNIAIAHASIDYLFGKRITLWEPSKR